MVDVFVSYCQKDKVYADFMDLYFKDKDITIHRDIRDIKDWMSIKEYMHTIRDMDYAILVITDNYLKSYNCMYEVLEVMKEKNYKDKIFPVLVETSIYTPKGRIPYIQYWEREFADLDKKLDSVNKVNLGPLTEDLKRTQNIAASISEFLTLVSDMNNPDIADINVAIENKLNEHGVLGKTSVAAQSKQQPAHDVFSSLNISRVSANTEPTDLEKNQFMIGSFKSINTMLEELCNQYQSENNGYQVEIDPVDTKNVIYRFYKNGNQVRGLKLFIGNTFGGRDMNIGISDMLSSTNNSSFSGMLSMKVEKGQLFLYFMITSPMNQRTMTGNEAVKDIWESYIQPYLKR